MLVALARHVSGTPKLYVFSFVEDVFMHAQSLLDSPQSGYTFSMHIQHLALRHNNYDKS